MAQITTAYDLGDTVWFNINSTVHKGEVMAISVFSRVDVVVPPSQTTTTTAAPATTIAPTTTIAPSTTLPPGPAIVTTTAAPGSTTTTTWVPPATSSPPITTLAPTPSTTTSHTTVVSYTIRSTSGTFFSVNELGVHASLADATDAIASLLDS